MSLGGIIGQAPDSGLSIGSIIMWYGQQSTIPEGWHICDGTNGTPNLKGKFVLGATGDNGTYGFKAVGGETGHTLTVNEMPSHSHGSGSLKTNSASEYSSSTTNTWRASNQGTIGKVGYLQAPTDTNTRYVAAPLTVTSSGSHTHAISGSTGSNGSSQPHNNMPPYYALYYIMKIA